MQKMNLKTLPTLTIKLVAGLLLVTMLLAGCNSPAPTTEAAPVVEVKPTEPPPPTAVPTAVPTEAPTPVPTPEKPGVNLDTPEHQAFLAAWEASPHGNTYDLGKGPNTYCSRCHSPQNWDPASTTDRPPNCVTCKFPTDPELRIATTMDFVSEEDWKGIGCETCHATEDGRVLSEVSWLNVVTMERETVATINELCTKCHVDSAGVKASGGRGVTHGISLGGSAHLNWAGALPQGHRPSYCSDCHDPHSLAPKQCIECHEAVLTLETHMKGTAASHQNLDCMACHDASGSDVAPFPADSETPYWTTVLTETSRSGATTTSYVKSHSIMWEVDCSRCHYTDNPWELEVYTADGSVPETTGN
jgi:NAD-dependent SIR2 family protein deacetylase